MSVSSNLAACSTVRRLVAQPTGKFPTFSEIGALSPNADQFGLTQIGPCVNWRQSSRHRGSNRLHTFKILQNLSPSMLGDSVQRCQELLFIDVSRHRWLPFA